MSGSFGRTRGAVYVLVLLTASAVTVIGLSALVVTRVETRATAARLQTVEARWQAESIVHLALARLHDDSNWRTTYTNDTWTSTQTFGDTSYRFKLIDESDADLADDPSDDARLYVEAELGFTKRLYSVVLRADEPPNLLRNVGVENGLVDWTGAGATGNCDIEQDSSTQIDGSYSLKTSNRSNNHAGPRQDVSDVIVNGQTYYSEVYINPGILNNTMYVVLELDTSNGIVLAYYQATWVATGWVKLSGTITPTWTGTLNSAVWRVGTLSTLTDFNIDNAMLVEGTGPPKTTMRPVTGTWRQELAE